MAAAPGGPRRPLWQPPHSPNTPHTHAHLYSWPASSLSSSLTTSFPPLNFPPPPPPAPPPPPGFLPFFCCRSPASPPPPPPPPRRGVASRARKSALLSPPDILPAASARFWVFVRPECRRGRGGWRDSGNRQRCGGVGDYNASTVYAEEPKMSTAGQGALAQWGRCGGKGRKMQRQARLPNSRHCHRHPIGRDKAIGSLRRVASVQLK